jgi:hypothetical protein
LPEKVKVGALEDLISTLKVLDEDNMFLAFGGLASIPC